MHSLVADAHLEDDQVLVLTRQRQSGAQVEDRLVVADGSVRQRHGWVRCAELVQLERAVVEDNDDPVPSRDEADVLDRSVAVEIPDKPRLIVDPVPQLVQAGREQDLQLQLFHRHLCDPPRELWLREE